MMLLASDNFDRKEYCKKNFEIWILDFTLHSADRVIII